MILKGNQRGGGGKLALHLANRADNDHVELHELRGFASADLAGAFQEIEAVATGTRCQQPFFSVSLNPPRDYPATFEQFEQAIDAIETKYPALADQPRAIVFHEKEGRRHCHAVWSRIDSERMRAIPLPFTRERLREASRSLFQEMGLEAPAGLRDRQQRDPLNYDAQTWQQAKRLGEDPRDLKAIIRQAWERSDNRASFERALECQALHLARGDRRGFVVVHHTGAAMSLTRYAGVKQKEIEARIGKPTAARSIEQVRDDIRARMVAGVEKRLDQAKQRQAREMRPLRERAADMKKTHQARRNELKAAQDGRQQREELTRGNRLRKGVLGLWDRLSGRRGKVSELNATEAKTGRVRDRDERQALIDRQREERRGLQAEIVQMREVHRTERDSPRAELAAMLAMMKEHSQEAEQGQEQGQEIEATKEPGRPGRGGDEDGGRERSRRERGPR